VTQTDLFSVWTPNGRGAVTPAFLGRRAKRSADFRLCYLLFQCSSGRESRRTSPKIPTFLSSRADLEGER
jgi:hypothetical protein